MQFPPGTEFEKPRGVSRIEVRGGYAQVHVTGLQDPIEESRLSVLRAVSSAGISLDFLKLTQNGISFLVVESQAEQVEAALKSGSLEFSVRTGAGVLIVHAVNMRDEEGLIARIVSIAIASGASIEHLADMHDRVLIVTEAEHAERLRRDFETRFLGVKV